MTDWNSFSRQNIRSISLCCMTVLTSKLLQCHSKFHHTCVLSLTWSFALKKILQTYTRSVNLNLNDEITNVLFNVSLETATCMALLQDWWKMNGSAAKLAKSIALGTIERTYNHALMPVLCFCARVRISINWVIQLTTVYYVQSVQLKWFCWKFKVNNYLYPLVDIKLLHAERTFSLAGAPPKYTYIIRIDT